MYHQWGAGIYCVPSMGLGYTVYHQWWGAGIDCVPSMGAGIDCVPSMGAGIDCVPSIGDWDRLCTINGGLG